MTRIDLDTESEAAKKIRLSVNACTISTH
jgi:hypothetical protein